MMLTRTLLADEALPSRASVALHLDEIRRYFSLFGIWWMGRPVYSDAGTFSGVEVDDDVGSMLSAAPLGRRVTEATDFFIAQIRSHFEAIGIRWEGRVIRSDDGAFRGIATPHVPFKTAPEVEATMARIHRLRAALEDVRRVCVGAPPGSMKDADDDLLATVAMNGVKNIVHREQAATRRAEELDAHVAGLHDTIAKLEGDLRLARGLPPCPEPCCDPAETVRTLRDEVARLKSARSDVPSRFHSHVGRPRRSR